MSSDNAVVISPAEDEPRAPASLATRWSVTPYGTPG